jgi:hypothetical protein
MATLCALSASCMGPEICRAGCWKSRKADRGSSILVSQFDSLVPHVDSLCSPFGLRPAVYLPLVGSCRATPNASHCLFASLRSPFGLPAAGFRLGVTEVHGFLWCSGRIVLGPPSIWSAALDS